MEEIRFIAKSSKATVIGISETKLDGRIFHAEIYIEGYSIVRCYRGRKGGGVACNIKHDICFNTKNILSKNIEVIFVDLLLPKTKPIPVGIVYGPPKMQIFYNYLEKF